jgi:hypothetical protein
MCVSRKVATFSEVALLDAPTRQVATLHRRDVTKVLTAAIVASGCSSISQ